MKMKHLFVVAAALVGANAMACYTVYAPGNRVVYNSELPPVDMSLPLHSALANAGYPAGSNVVFDQSATCRSMSLAQMARAETRVASVPDTRVMGAGPAVDTRVMGAGPAPGTAARHASSRVASASQGLDRRTASSSPLLTDRHTAESMNLPYNVLGGDIVVVPAQAAARVNLPNMTVVPSSAAPVRMSRASTRGETVITELHNPPLTVVQAGNDTIVSR